MPQLYARLGQYRMPFAWAVRPLFDSAEELDTTAEFSPFYRQDREKFTDEDMLKILSDFRSQHKQKFPVIPGDLKVEVLPLQGDLPKCETLCYILASIIVPAHRHTGPIPAAS